MPETPPKLAHTGNADGENQGSTREGGHEQSDDDGHVTVCREELDSDRPRVLGQEVHQSDAEHHADHQGGPGPADPGGSCA